MQYLAEMVFRYDADDALVKKVPIYKRMADDHFEEVVHIVFAPWIHGIRLDMSKRRMEKKTEANEK